MLIHRRIIQDFEVTENLQQDKSANEVGSNYSYNSVKEWLNGKALRAVQSVLIPATQSVWVQVKGKEGIPLNTGSYSSSHVQGHAI